MAGIAYMHTYFQMTTAGTMIRTVQTIEKS